MKKIIISILVVVVLIIGFIVYNSNINNNSSINKNQDQVNTNTQTSLNTPKNSSSDTSDWKVHIDGASALSFKYPKTWRSLKAPGCSESYGPEGKSYFISVCGPGYSGDAVGNDTLISKNPTVIGGYSAIRQEIVRNNNQYGIEITVKDVKYNTVESNRTVSKIGDWTIYYVIPREVDKVEAMNILDIILTTFQFTK